MKRLRDWRRPAASLTAGAALMVPLVRPDHEHLHTHEDWGQDFPANGSCEIATPGTAILYQAVIPLAKRGSIEP
jgi:hypothetical protein